MTRAQAVPDLEIDCRGVYYRRLNEEIRAAAADGARRIVLRNVEGQRYIGAGLKFPDLEIRVHGVPGQDMAAFMDGPRIDVANNAQDAVGNTMNEGRIVVRGLAGDVIGYGMRGGRIYVRDDVGYRVGIHMKGYLDKQPLLVVGGCAGNFLGEYMAGGCLVVLGATTDTKQPSAGRFCAAGMHGGVMYIRGAYDEATLGREVKTFPLGGEDVDTLAPILREFRSEFGIETPLDDYDRYTKIIPVSSRPYGRLYAY